MSYDLVLKLLLRERKYLIILVLNLMIISIEPIFNADVFICARNTDS